jgi:solute:Na+ symporter, SSS family
MNLLDFLVLVGSMAGIAAYGVWQTRGRQGLSHYVKGDARTGWIVIGLSVMATQASAVTFLSTPGQGYQDGLGFVQNYFGAPLALILIAAVFLPIYRRLNVYTAYEYLGRRFDRKTRLLGAALFLLQRGLQAGITVYAPAIILSTVLHWRTDATILLTGLVVIVYTAAGGSQAVNLTQKYQLGVIFCGMLLAFVVLLRKMPAEVGLADALTLAGGFHKLNGVDFSIDTSRRYTFWSGSLGGFFLALSYFGTDQSQVQRYLSGGSLRESRMGLMFNAVLKIPMQFFILLLGTMVFVFYQFEAPPLCFNQAAWESGLLRDSGDRLRTLERRYVELHAEKQVAVEAWLGARNAGDRSAEAGARAQALAAHNRGQAVRAEAKAALESLTPRGGKSSDTDYVFITFILRHLPHGIIGLLIAAFFGATLSSKAAELNALATTTTVDFYRFLVTRQADDAHYVSASRWFTVMWGMVAVGFALFASLAENLVQAVNIVASIFYGVVLGLFLVAFFLRWVQGTAVFLAAIAAQLLVFALFARLDISYLWYNLIGCVACMGFSLALQAAIGPGVTQAEAPTNP